MKILASSSLEDFEADLIRHLGLTLSIEQLRRIGNSSWPHRPSITAATAQQTAVMPVAQPADFETRYKACQTTAERQFFVRAHRAEAREYLRTHQSAEQPTAAATPTVSASVTRPRSLLIRRKLK